MTNATLTIPSPESIRVRIEMEWTLAECEAAVVQLLAVRSSYEVSRLAEELDNLIRQAKRTINNLKLVVEE